MQWLAENWLTLLLVVGMLAVHLFGHGHGRHRVGRQRDRATGRPHEAEQPDDKPA